MTGRAMQAYDSCMARQNAAGTHRLLSCMIHEDQMRLVDAYARSMRLSRTSAVVLLLDQGLAGVRAGAPQPALFTPDMEVPREQ